MSELALQLEKIGLDDIDCSDWPQSLTDMAEVIDAELKRQGLVSEDSDELPSLCIALSVVQVYQGSSHYMPRCDKVAISLRNALIWREFNGRNVAELARRNGLTDRQLYSIIAEERGRRATPQQTLFAQA